MSRKTPPPALRILMAEDNPGDVRIVEEALRARKEACELEAVPDGVALLAHLKTAADQGTLPDLLLLDLNMPQLGGLDALRTIKADPRLRSLPILVLSSSKQASDVQGAYDAHANCYIQKPLGLDDYFAVVNDITDFWHKTVHLPNKVHS